MSTTFIVLAWLSVPLGLISAAVNSALIVHQIRRRRRERQGAA